jgi:hypothetical protein
MRRRLLLLALVITASCGVLGIDDGTPRILEVAPYKGSCYEHIIMVREEDIDAPLADGSSVRRTLQRVLSKLPVAPGATFELIVPPHWLDPAGAGRYVLLLGPEEVACDTGQSCTELAGAVEAGDRVLLVLSYAPPPGAPFEVIAWTKCTGDAGPCTTS